jgi:two-component system NtrC family sensor kinase
VRQISPASITPVESIKQRRDLMGVKGELERVQRKLDRAERALESLSRILTLIPDPIEVVSGDYSILFANRASHLLHEIEHLEGTLYYQSVMGLEEPPEHCPIRRAIDDDREAAYTAACENGDVFEVTVTPVELSDGRRAAMCLSRLKPEESAKPDSEHLQSIEPGDEDDIPDVDDVWLEDADAGADVEPAETDGGIDGHVDDFEREEGMLLRQIAELSTQSLDAVLDQISDGVLMIDSRGDLILANSAFRATVGLSGREQAPLDPSSVLSIPGGGTRASLAATLAKMAQGGTALSEATVVRGDGERLPVDLAVSKVPGEPEDETVLLVTIRDKSETALLKDHLVKALGSSLAAGRIAEQIRDVNGCLASALYHSERLSKQGEWDGISSGELSTVQKHIFLAQEAISRVLSLTRPAVLSAVNVNQLISEIFTRRVLADELQRDNIEIVQRYDAGMVETAACAALLQQALANIISYAGKSMARAKGGGRLIVLTESSPSAITIRVSDDGSSALHDHGNELFRLGPLSTDGRDGRAGLFFAKEVINRHKGNIDVKSSPNEGVTFIVRLPVVVPVEDPGPEGEETAVRAARDEAVQDEVIPEGERDGAAKGRILVIDDEAAIVEQLSVILSDAGHTVVTSPNPVDALKKIRSTRFDCVVCDIRMPDMEAAEFAGIIEQHDAGSSRRLVFVSGDIINRETAEFIQQSGLPCIEKPFSAAKVRDVVGGVLSPRGS